MAETIAAIVAVAAMGVTAVILYLVARERNR